MHAFSVKYFSPTTNLCIIRVGRDHHKIAWGTVTLLKTLQGKSYIPNVIHVSGWSIDNTHHVNMLYPWTPTGTIKQAQLAAITHNREAVTLLRSQAKIPCAFFSFTFTTRQLKASTRTAMYQHTYDQYLETSTNEIEALQD